MNFDWYLDPIVNNYANFSGRASRQQFWMFFVYSLVIGVAIAVITALLGAAVISWIYALALIVPNLALGCRRLHDTGKSGWLQLVGLIPIIGGVVLIVLFAMPGDTGTNAYGPAAAGQPQPSLA